MSQAKQIYYHKLRKNVKNMSPQFKELAIEAGAYPKDDTILTGPMDLAKFAELIVQECSELFANTYTTIDGDRGPGVAIASKLVKRHFGLEE